jgi:hypothetical protein
VEVVGLREAIRILLAGRPPARSFCCLRLIAGIHEPSPRVQLAILPFGVLAINFVVAYLESPVRVVRRMTANG